MLFCPYTPKIKWQKRNQMTSKTTFLLKRTDGINSSLRYVNFWNILGKHFKISLPSRGRMFREKASSAPWTQLLCPSFSIHFDSLLCEVLLFPLCLRPMKFLPESDTHKADQYIHAEGLRGRRERKWEGEYLNKYCLKH